MPWPWLWSRWWLVCDLWREYPLAGWEERLFGEHLGFDLWLLDRLSSCVAVVLSLEERSCWQVEPLCGEVLLLRL